MHLSQQALIIDISQAGRCCLFQPWALGLVDSLAVVVNVAYFFTIVAGGLDFYYGLTRCRRFGPLLSCELLPAFELLLVSHQPLL